MLWELVLLLASVYCCSARPHSQDKYLLPLEDGLVPADSLRRVTREHAPLSHATEVSDLLNDGNASGKKADIKKQMKNASGKTEEGGYYKTYGSDAEGEKGYRKETYGNGEQGYKTFDTFHKRDGDSYGFEKHTSYGMGHGDKKAGNYKDGGSYAERNGDHDAAGTIVDEHYSVADVDHGSGGPESSHYIGGGGASDHYVGDYTSQSGEEPKSYSFRRGTSYSVGEGDDGAYESHSSYSDGDGEHESDR